MKNTVVTSKHTGPFSILLECGEPILNVLADSMLSTGKVWEHKFLDWFGDMVGDNKEQEMLIVDIGANIGSFSLFSMRAFPKAVVWAFEPMPELYRVLAANVSRTGVDLKCESWLCLPIALGHVNKEVLMNRVLQNEGQSHIAVAGGGDVTVPMARFDDIDIPKLEGWPVVVKMDVEGFEPYVIHGMPKFLAERQPALMLENNSIQDARECLRLLSELDLGYSITHIMQTDEGSENTICVYETDRRVLCRRQDSDRSR